MPLSNREIAKIATAVRDRLNTLSLFRYSELIEKLKMLTASIEHFQNVGRRLKICVSKRWLAAAADVSKELTGSLLGLTYDSKAIEKSATRLDQPFPTVPELVAELRQVEKEFGELIYDRRERFAAVTTNTIELEGVNLGEFEIRLSLSSVQDRQHSEEMYGVVALDPNPPRSDDSVTHPHVRDGQLCEGEASAAIGSALRDGRICDFFLLVRSVLGQYNPTHRTFRWTSGTASHATIAAIPSARETSPAATTARTIFVTTVSPRAPIAEKLFARTVWKSA